MPYKDKEHIIRHFDSLGNQIKSLGRNLSSVDKLDYMQTSNVISTLDQTVRALLRDVYRINQMYAMQNGERYDYGINELIYLINKQWHPRD